MAMENPPFTIVYWEMSHQNLMPGGASGAGPARGL